MTPVESMFPLEKELVRAIGAGSFDEAKGLLSRLSQQASEKLIELPAGQREAGRAHVLRVLRWALSMVRIERAQACAQMSELPPASSYKQPRPLAGGHLRLQG